MRLTSLHSVVTLWIGIDQTAKRWNKLPPRVKHQRDTSWHHTVIQTETSSYDAFQCVAVSKEPEPNSVSSLPTPSGSRLPGTMQIIAIARPSYHQRPDQRPKQNPESQAKSSSRRCNASTSNCNRPETTMVLETSTCDELNPRTESNHSSTDYSI